VRTRSAAVTIVALVALVMFAGCAVPQVASAPDTWGVPSNSGSGRRVVYRNSTQQVWLIGDHGEVSDAFLVSGRRGVPNPGTYQVHRKLDTGWSGSLRLPYFVGFAYGRSTDIGFHGIPLSGSGQPIQSDRQLGQPLSHGCVRVAQDKALAIWMFTEVGSTVVVLA